MTPDAFHAVLNPLALATNRVLDDALLDVYYTSLSDVPQPTLEAAVGRLVTSAKYFPSVGEIRGACDRVSATKAMQMFTVPALPPAGVMDENDPRLWYTCTTCNDSGWASHWCPGSVHAQPKRPEQYQSIRPCGSSACARFGAKGYGHEFTVRCVCYTTNPKIRERLESRRKYAAEP